MYTITTSPLTPLNIRQYHTHKHVFHNYIRNVKLWQYIYKTQFCNNFTLFFFVCFMCNIGVVFAAVAIMQTGELARERGETGGGLRLEELPPPGMTVPRDTATPQPQPHLPPPAGAPAPASGLLNATTTPEHKYVTKSSNILNIRTQICSQSYVRVSCLDDIWLCPNSERSKYLIVGKNIYRHRHAK